MALYGLERFPKIDLHGEYTSTVYTVVHEFLKEQQKLRNSQVILIHGKGTGKLKEEIHYILKKEPMVLEYNLDPYNLGQTIVKIKLDK